MTLDSTSPKSPPPYDEVVNELWDPTFLVLSDLSIHAESVDAAPLYQLNRAVATITQATKQVEFERIERKIKTNAEEPVVKPRSRHIYNLKIIKA
jgi:hypothetical protein